MRRKKERNAVGSVEVEATFILPVAILCVILLLYLSLLLFQRANLQACLETCLVYYKNSVTDTYVERNSEVSYTSAEGEQMARGNSYRATGPLNPYVGMFETTRDVENEAAFQEYFESVAGKMLFDKDLKITINYTNYFLVKKYEATAYQTVTLPIDFSLVGLDNQYEITATARAAVSDHDDMIRTVDYMIDLTEDTVVGDFFKNIGSKVKEGYEKMKKVLKV